MNLAWRVRSESPKTYFYYRLDKPREKERQGAMTTDRAAAAAAVEEEGEEVSSLLSVCFHSLGCEGLDFCPAGR